jgi:hypothetical protein
MSHATYSTQNDAVMEKINRFYDNYDNLDRMLRIIKGETIISLRIVDWFTTNYAKKYYTVYTIVDSFGAAKRFKVYIEYKLKLDGYSKKKFDPFCRWDRINIPYKDNKYIETTIGQLNFFMWAIENKVIDYIEENYETIEKDMNSRNSTSKRKETVSATTTTANSHTKTRKKREELSISATKSIKKEEVEIIVKFN